MRPQPIWPPGFENLHTIIIGGPFSSVSAPSLDHGFLVDPIERLSAANVAPLFLLPHLRSVYLRGLYEDRYDVEPFGPDFTLPEKSLSLEHLFLDRAHPEAVKHAINAIIKSAKALKSLIVKDCEFNDLDHMVGCADSSSGNANTLETLLWSEEEGDLRGYRSSKFYVDETVPGMYSIRVLALDMSDVLQCCTVRYSDKECADKVEGYEFSHTDFIEYFQWLVSDSARSLEVVVFKVKYGVFFEAAARVINDAIIHIVKDAFEEGEEEEDEEDEEEEKEEDEEDDKNETDEVEEEEQEDDLKEEEREGYAAMEAENEENDDSDDDDDGINEEEEEVEDRPLRLRDIYLDEVVGSFIKEGIKFEGYEKYREPEFYEKDRVFGALLFKEAVLKCREHGITLHLDEGSTARYFQEVCDGIFKL